MNKIIKYKNANNRKIALLLVFRVLCVIAAAVLPVLLVIFKLYRNMPFTIVILILVLICVIAFPLLSKRYNILYSGKRGEKQLFRIVKRLKGNNIIFTNLPVKYKYRSEIDTLLINQGGILIIEAKNHSGSIYGNWRADKWKHHKYLHGKNTAFEIDNPIKQMSRQRDIVKGILNVSGENVKVETVLFFANDSVKLNLSLRENDNICHGSAELLDFLEKFGRKKVLSKSRMDNCADVFIKARFN